jgi:hypothetical protein
MLPLRRGTLSLTIIIPSRIMITLLGIKHVCSLFFVLYFKVQVMEGEVIYEVSVCTGLVPPSMQHSHVVGFKCRLAEGSKI